MTPSEQEEALRRALHAVADAIEPAADGLERIRERLSRPRPLAVAWLMAGWTGLAQPVLLRMEPVLAGAAGRMSDRLATWLRLMIRSLGAVRERLRPAGMRLRLELERLRPAGELLVDAIRLLRPRSGMSRHEKLRSALAFAAAALIGAAGGFALSAGLPQSMISAASSVFSAGTQHNANDHGPGSGLGSGKPMTQQSGTGPGSTHKPSVSPSPTCTPAPKPSALPTSSSPTPSPPTSSPPTPSPPTSSPPTPSPPTSSPPTPTPTPTPQDQQAPAGPRSSLAGVHARADVGTGGVTPSTTQPSRAADSGSVGSSPAATTQASPKPTSSAGMPACR